MRTEKNKREELGTRNGNCEEDEGGARSEKWELKRMREELGVRNGKREEDEGGARSEKWEKGRG